MQVFHSIASLLLMASVLLSSTGVRLSQHWCGKTLVSAAFFGEANPCDHYEAETSEKPSCPFHERRETQNKCCDQRETIVDGNDYDYEIQVTNASMPDYVVSLILPVLYLISKDDQERTTPKYLNHSPPLIGSDILVRIQSFRL